MYRFSWLSTHMKSVCTSQSLKHPDLFLWFQARTLCCTTSSTSLTKTQPAFCRERNSSSWSTPPSRTGRKLSTTLLCSRWGDRVRSAACKCVFKPPVWRKLICIYTRHGAQGGLRLSLSPSGALLENWFCDDLRSHMTDSASRETPSRSLRSTCPSSVLACQFSGHLSAFSHGDQLAEAAGC